MFAAGCRDRLFSAAAIPGCRVSVAVRWLLIVCVGGFSTVGAQLWSSLTLIQNATSWHFILFYTKNPIFTEIFYSISKKTV